MTRALHLVPAPASGLLRSYRASLVAPPDPSVSWEATGIQASGAAPGVLGLPGPARAPWNAAPAHLRAAWSGKGHGLWLASGRIGSSLALAAWEGSESWHVLGRLPQEAPARMMSREGDIESETLPADLVIHELSDPVRVYCLDRSDVSQDLVRAHGSRERRLTLSEMPPPTPVGAAVFAPQLRHPAPTRRLSCWVVGGVALGAVPCVCEAPDHNSSDEKVRVRRAALRQSDPVGDPWQGRPGRVDKPHPSPTSPTRSKEGDRRCARLCPDERPQGGRQPLGRHGRGTAGRADAAAQPDAEPVSRNAPWLQISRILARIHPPHFPSRFDVRDYGAIADGTALCAGTFRRAITSSSRTVWSPAGGTDSRSAARCPAGPTTSSPRTAGSTPPTSTAVTTPATPSSSEPTRNGAAPWAACTYADPRGGRSTATAFI